MPKTDIRKEKTAQGCSLPRIEGGIAEDLRSCPRLVRKRQFAASS